MIMALMQTDRSSRWVRAVVPASGKFTIYLDASVSSTTYVLGAGRATVSPAKARSHRSCDQDRDQD
jgi:hypothetical protein